jgi:hypothetical protein
MSGIPPVIRHMLLCEDVSPNRVNPRKLNVFGLLSTLRSSGDPPLYPVVAQFCVYLLMAGGRGEGFLRIVISFAETAEVIYMGQEHPIAFEADPLKVHAASVRVSRCEFPFSGLYWVELWYNGEVLCTEPLQVGE